MTENNWTPTPDDMGFAFRHLNSDDQAVVLGRMANIMSFDPTTRGLTLGLAIARQHRTIQGVLVNWLISILVGLAGAPTDARNEQAIQACDYIREAVDRGDLPYQPFI